VVTGMADFSKVGNGPIVAFPTPFHLGAPTFEIAAIISMLIVVLVILTETMADILAVGEIVGTRTDSKRIAAGLRADMGSSLIAPIFGSFTQSAFAQNVGLVAVTKIKSRYVVAAGGVILVLLGLLPKMAALVESLPTVVLGGAGLVMFGMVAATGIRILAGVNFTSNRFNSLIVAISIGIGMIPLIAPNFKQWIPAGLHPLIESGILLASMSAVLLNLFLNGAKEDDAGVIRAARQAEAH
jgi:uric acid transporter